MMENISALEKQQQCRGEIVPNLLHGPVARRVFLSRLTSGLNNFLQVDPRAHLSLCLSLSLSSHFVLGKRCVVNPGMR